MNFIEQCLHISPDGGTGSLEGWCVALVLISMFLYIVRKRVGAPSDARSATRS
jgi:hypothetical protein